MRQPVPDVQVLHGAHVVELGTQAVDEVRRRLPQEQPGRRGRQDHLLDEIRGCAAAPGYAGTASLRDRRTRAEEVPRPPGSAARCE